MNGRRFYCGLAGTLLTVLGLSAAGMGASHNELEESLTAKYTMTKTGIDRMRITEPGTVLMVQQDGIDADLAGDASYTDNPVRDGRVGQAKGFMASMQSKETSRTLKAGDKVYVYKIEVKDDKVRYFIITCDTYDVNVHGSTKQTRYKAMLSFEFGKDYMATADANGVKKAVDVLIIPEADAKAASTKSVDLGQTTDQVEAILGKPDRIVNLGAKKIYIYKDMKIIFVDDKVSDVQ
jgi:hypothetical protein